MIESVNPEFVNLAPSSSTVLKEVLAGLSKSQKSLPPKLLYDKRGSEIFEKICLLKEYYPTRAETEILKNHALDICHMIGEGSVIVEPGSGAGDKIRHLLPHLIKPKAYVPIEISKDILLRMTEEFIEEFPQLKVIPVWADFNQSIELPLTLEYERAKKVVFFPGSTIGNFNPQEAIEFLKHMAKVVGHGGGLVIGVDMKKSPEVFKLAYDDPHGVTADFNLNLLQRINREAAASFDIRNFTHEAIYDEKLGRVEMHLVSNISQLVRVNETVFRFRKGETIHTESSYKYTVDEFAELGAKAGWQIKKFWKNNENQFCVYYFEHE
jgi:dimethylhistidine N-methyltransferase